MRTLAVWLGSLLLVACPTEPGYETQKFDNGSGRVVVNIQRVVAQPELYQEVAECAGLVGVGNPLTLEWYRLVDGEIVFPDGKRWYGVYVYPDRAIYFTDSLNLRHEILHDLLYLDRRETGHPRPPFGECSR